jgi:glycoside/pentoside/hexuronide:cation symporter, GPH family
MSTISQFLLLYYNQVLGLPAASVGLAISAGLMVNAFWDPIVGSWSDRSRTRLGRRHPFMFAAIVPIGISFWALFNPPGSLGQTGQLLWLGIGNIFLQQALAVFHTPHLALGGELSQNYYERSNVMSYNTFCLWAGDTLCWVFSFGVFFSAHGQYSNGALDPTRWPFFSLVMASVVVTILSISAFFTRSRIPFLRQADPAAPRFSPREFGRDVARAVTNRNYLMMLIGYFFQSLMTGVRGGLWIYTATYFWQLKNDQIVYFSLGSFVGYVFGATVVMRLHRRIDKRWTGAGAALLYSVGPVIPLALGYFGVLRPDTPGLLGILIAFSLLQHIPYSLMTTTFYSALADMADENELKYGVRQEGVLYSTRTFFARIDQAVGAAFAGWVLTFIAFPTKAVPGQVDTLILSNLSLAFIASALPGIVSVIFYASMRTTRDRYEATRVALGQRVNRS